jgi:hypothetical protein
VKSEKVDILR